MFGPKERQHDVVYLPVGKPIEKFGFGDVAIRVRDSDGAFTMTLKQRVGSKDNELRKIEKEVIIDDLQQ